MKRNVRVIVLAIAVILLIIVVITIEKKNRTPIERYLETNQASNQEKKTAPVRTGKNSYIPKEIINDDGNLKYEFLSYDLIDDKDIATQTKYKAEFFIEGKTPPTDYIVEYIDYDSMAKDYPKFDEYRNSNCEKGMTKSEYEEFMRQHKAEYTINKHIKTKYLFIKCRITYIGGGRNEEWLNNIDVFAMRENRLVGESNNYCYFDHSQHSTGEERENEFFIYRFDKIGDSIECVLGCRLIGDEIDMSEENTYYIGFQPSVSYSDYEQFNPAIDSRCVAIADMPNDI